MNERIKKLSEQAAISCGDFIGPGLYTRHKEEMEKFAELIVWECLSIVENNNPRPPGTTLRYSLAKDEYFDTGWQVAVETKSNQIKQHFGVK